MLTLTIVRHAKSSWSSAHLSDLERPLNSRGKSQARMMGDWLEETKSSPDLIICSSARRARQTLNKLMENWKTEAKIIKDERLYLASPRSIIALLDELGAPYSHIMIIGHNPGLHMLANLLANTTDKDENDSKGEMQLLEEKYPTAAICVIQSTAAQWKKIDQIKGKLLSFVTPKTLRSS